jgi:hypothetical protein
MRSPCPENFPANLVPWLFVPALFVVLDEEASVLIFVATEKMLLDQNPLILFEVFRASCAGALRSRMLRTMRLPWRPRALGISSSGSQSGHDHKYHLARR